MGHTMQLTFGLALFVVGEVFYYLDPSNFSTLPLIAVGCVMIGLALGHMEKK